MPLESAVSRRAAERLRAFRKDIEKIMPGRIEEVLLFGSRARREGKRGSDFDVAIFVRDLEDRRVVDDALTDVAYPYILGGMAIRPVAVPFDILGRIPPLPLAIDLVRDGIRIE